MIRKKHFMSLQALIILAAIHEYGGKRKVTENLGTSVDTINKYLSILEDEVRYNLLVSDGRGTTLKGDVRVSMPLSVFIALSHDNIGNFFDKYSNINIVSLSSLELPNFNSLDVDLGLTYVPPEGSDVVIISDKKIECGFFASSKYLSEHGYPADFDDMLENHWIVSKGSVQTYMKSWKEVIKRAKHIRYDSNSASAAIDMVRNGAGIAVMPMRFKDEGLVCLDNFKYDNEITVYLVAKKKSKDNPKVRAVIDYYKQSLSRM
ncbi:MAG: LysR substrate-binding domain-containing protein [Alphaproteobacteria bacterium]